MNNNLWTSGAGAPNQVPNKELNQYCELPLMKDTRYIFNGSSSAPSGHLDMSRSECAGSVAAQYHRWSSSHNYPLTHDYYQRTQFSHLQTNSSLRYGSWNRTLVAGKNYRVDQNLSNANVMDAIYRHGHANHTNGTIINMKPLHVINLHAREPTASNNSISRIRSYSASRNEVLNPCTLLNHPNPNDQLANKDSQISSSTGDLHRTDLVESGYSDQFPNWKVLRMMPERSSSNYSNNTYGECDDQDDIEYLEGCCSNYMQRDSYGLRYGTGRKIIRLMNNNASSSSISSRSRSTTPRARILAQQAHMEDMLTSRDREASILLPTIPTSAAAAAAASPQSYALVHKNNLQHTSVMNQSHEIPPPVQHSHHRLFQTSSSRVEKDKADVADDVRERSSTAGTNAQPLMMPELAVPRNHNHTENINQNIHPATACQDCSDLPQGSWEALLQYQAQSLLMQQINMKKRKKKNNGNIGEENSLQESFQPLLDTPKLLSSPPYSQIMTARAYHDDASASAASLNFTEDMIEPLALLTEIEEDYDESNADDEAVNIDDSESINIEKQEEDCELDHDDDDPKVKDAASSMIGRDVNEQERGGSIRRATAPSSSNNNSGIAASSRKLQAANRSLSQKYRPKGFEDVIGQSVVIRALSNAISREKIAPVYLFHGPRGTGKTSTARIFAAALRCTGSSSSSSSKRKNNNSSNNNSSSSSSSSSSSALIGSSSSGSSSFTFHHDDNSHLQHQAAPGECNYNVMNAPCTTCKECIAVACGTSPHVKEVDAASNNDIGRVKLLLHQASFSTHPGSLTSCSRILISGYKVFIIDECHVLTTETWNALLNILEEPPLNVVFILITTEPDQLPRTAMSRCHRFLFPKIKESDIVQRLQMLSAMESLDVDIAILELIASRSDGSLRDAETTLDQISLLGKGSDYSTAAVHELVGTASDECVGKLLDCCLRGDSVGMIRGVRELLHSGIQPLPLMCRLATLITDVIAAAGSTSTSLSSASTCTSFNNTTSNSTHHNDVTCTSAASTVNVQRRDHIFLPNQKTTGAGGQDLEQLCMAMKTLSDAEKQLRGSSNSEYRATWLIAALLRLAPPASPVPVPVPVPAPYPTSHHAYIMTDLQDRFIEGELDPSSAATNPLLTHDGGKRGNGSTDQTSTSTGCVVEYGHGHDHEAEAAYYNRDVTSDRMQATLPCCSSDLAATLITQTTHIYNQSLQGPKVGDASTVNNNNPSSCRWTANTSENIMSDTCIKRPQSHCIVNDDDDEVLAPSGRHETPSLQTTVMPASMLTDITERSTEDHNARSMMLLKTAGGPKARDHPPRAEIISAKRLEEIWYKAVERCYVRLPLKALLHLHARLTSISVDSAEVDNAALVHMEVSDDPELNASIKLQTVKKKIAQALESVLCFPVTLQVVKMKTPNVNDANAATTDEHCNNYAENTKSTENGRKSDHDSITNDYGDEIVQPMQAHSREDYIITRVRRKEEESIVSATTEDHDVSAISGHGTSATAACKKRWIADAEIQERTGRPASRVSGITDGRAVAKGNNNNCGAPPPATATEEAVGGQCKAQRLNMNGILKAAAGGLARLFFSKRNNNTSK